MLHAAGEPSGQASREGCKAHHAQQLRVSSVVEQQPPDGDPKRGPGALGELPRGHSHPGKQHQKEDRMARQCGEDIFRGQGCEDAQSVGELVGDHAEEDAQNQRTNQDRMSEARRSRPKRG